MPQQIFIQPNDQYNVAGDALWQINLGRITQRDIPVNPNKIDRFTLLDLLKHAGFTGISKFKKAQLVQIFNQWYVFL